MLNTPVANETRTTKDDQEHVLALDMLPDDGPIRKSGINKSGIEYVGLNANPILGCYHACKYCYAKKIDVRFKNVESEEDWYSPKYFQNYLDIVKNELENGNIDPNREIFLSTMTDIYQPFAVKFNIANQLIVLLQEYNCTYRILTKSPSIVRDIDILSGYEKGLIGLSITTDANNECQRKFWEPNTVSIQKRLDALDTLNNNGDMKLWVSAEPFLPNTSFEKYYEDIIKYGGSSLIEIVIGKMNYEKGIDKMFEWEKVVKVSEKYRKDFCDNIKFHYKKEFWKFLVNNNLTPFDLKLRDYNNTDKK